MSKINFKEKPPLMFLLVNNLALINLTWLLIQSIFLNESTIAIGYYVAIIISGFIGVSLLHKKLILRSNLFCITLVGSLSFVLMSVFKNMLIALIALAFTLGISFGLTTPIYLSIFAIYSEIGKRGRFGGFLLFFTQLYMVTSCILLNLDASTTLLVMAGLNTINVICLSFYKPFAAQSGNTSSCYCTKNAIKNRAFILYFVPWFMFCLINYIEGPILHQFLGREFQTYVLAVSFLVGVSAPLGGFICDLKGRKMAGILGFVLLGMSYGILSLFYSVDIVRIFFMVAEGVTWGILYVTFVFVIWGDISEGDDKEIYYFLGNLPFLLSNVIYFFAEKFKIAEIIAVSASFSVASFFIFLAVVPLLYAPETLPERVIREKELRSYVEKAKRLAEKYS
ncbi:MAG: hypothetical protein QXO20_07855 [Candidatus Bathyarchaeia archaeon]